jgi:hypothetical protein
MTSRLFGYSTAVDAGYRVLRRLRRLGLLFKRQRGVNDATLEVLELLIEMAPRSAATPSAADVNGPQPTGTAERSPLR